jgi:hypothetical protein
MGIQEAEIGRALHTPGQMSRSVGLNRAELCGRIVTHEMRRRRRSVGVTLALTRSQTERSRSKNER